ncbi:MAG: hypothetical protein NVS9B2_22500 [Steroidobacteraceae bacterium]
MHPAVLTILACAAGCLAAASHADDACLDFKWDVSKERELFAATAAALTVGEDLKTAPAIEPNRLYALRLVAQTRVTFAVPPPVKAAGAAAYGGLARLKLPLSGSYRIALDVPLWIDVVTNGTRVAAEDFQEQKGCTAPHKIVSFNLAGVQPQVLQLSNAKDQNILLTVTPSPSRKR